MTDIDFKLVLSGFCPSTRKSTAQCSVVASKHQKGHFGQALRWLPLCARMQDLGSDAPVLPGEFGLPVFQGGGTVICFANGVPSGQKIIFMFSISLLKYS